ncbi:MAG: hypothetical protein DM484_15195 [Candidatus Methylumidiphilus alinenensis]|uniref:Uncharacterized protein n=1 Tax=Candidatus Methylumidiphilus alinenensis TaxID=2202197 RepID=A0A2W4R297_9GAMM|nr:MAG: hypothetical protein DM484_15195 [Candidatus Methylumidiphilus alinenensis]
MDGDISVAQRSIKKNCQSAVSHPCGLDSGNPCRNDGFSCSVKLVLGDFKKSFYPLLLQKGVNVLGNCLID